jgi:hypothetical protein
MQRDVCTDLHRTVQGQRPPEDLIVDRQIRRAADALDDLEIEAGTFRCLSKRHVVRNGIQPIESIAQQLRGIDGPCVEYVR